MSADQNPFTLSCAKVTKITHIVVKNKLSQALTYMRLHTCILYTIANEWQVKFCNSKFALELEQRRYFARKTRPLMLYIHRHQHPPLIRSKNPNSACAKSHYPPRFLKHRPILQGEAGKRGEVLLRELFILKTLLRTAHARRWRLAAIIQLSVVKHTH